MHTGVPALNNSSAGCLSPLLLALCIRPSAGPQVLMKPGGHGVIWKLMLDTGVFDWLGAQGRQAAIVRQIRCGCGRRAGARS